MQYYCNECKKTITIEEFQYSMNKFKKALCRNHQCDRKLGQTTKNLKDLVLSRHKDELKNEKPSLKSIKDWINADYDIWDKVIKKEREGSYIIKFSEESAKHNYIQNFKKKDDEDLKS